MMTVFVNYWAVIVAAISSMVLGYVWYGPLFAKAWMKEIGKTEAEIRKNAKPSMYGFTFVGALVTAYVLAHFVYYAGATTAANGALTGFWAWLGFVATSMLSIKIFENRSWNLYAINTGYYLVMFIIMGIILAVWQ